MTQTLDLEAPHMREADTTSALVLGGTGAVGREVLRALARKNVETTFTFLRSREVANDLSAETGQRSVELDLSDQDAIRRFLEQEQSDHGAPDVVVYCAGVVGVAALADVTDHDWLRVQAVNCQGAFTTVQSLAPGMASRGGGDIVLIGALDRAQSLPIPVPFAASQGMLSAMVMAMAKELGPMRIRINMVALGLLEEGLSTKLAPASREDFTKYSALKRMGTPHEVAQAIVWLALHNMYMNGKVIPVNGGI